MLLIVLTSFCLGADWNCSEWRAIFETPEFEAPFSSLVSEIGGFNYEEKKYIWGTRLRNRQVETLFLFREDAEFLYITATDSAVGLYRVNLENLVTVLEDQVFHDGRFRNSDRSLTDEDRDALFAFIPEAKELETISIVGLYEMGVKILERE